MERWSKVTQWKGLEAMIGLAVGIIAGVIQYWLLSRFTAYISKGEMHIKGILLGMLQFFLPMGVLVGIAFVKQSYLLWTAIGITVSLLLCAIIKNLINTRKMRGREDNND